MCVHMYADVITSVKVQNYMEISFLQFLRFFSFYSKVIIRYSPWNLLVSFFLNLTHYWQKFSRVKKTKRRSKIDSDCQTKLDLGVMIH